MRVRGALAVLALTAVHAPMVAAVAPPPVVVSVTAERFDVAGEGNTVTGVRRAPVPYDSLARLVTALHQPTALPSAVRLVRATPPRVIDYVFCVTDDGLLIVGQQIRDLDATSGQYRFVDGGIKRAYSALEAKVPWTWFVDIPLGREVELVLEVEAMSPTWPVRAVTVRPRVSQ
jgi:hypothetical protein